MAKTINLEVITPSRRFYKGDVELVIVRTLEGDEGYMAGHTWACKLLDVGELWFKEPNNSEYRVAALSGGFVDVQDDIVIYTDDALWADDIDEKRAKAEKEKAEDWLSHDMSNDPLEHEKAKIAINKAITRLNVKNGGMRRKR